MIFFTRVLSCRPAGDLFIRQRSFHLNKTYAWLAIRIVSLIAACLMPTSWAQSGQPTPARLLSVTPTSDRTAITRWQGGTGPYQLQRRTCTNMVWEDVDGLTSDTSMTNVMSSSVMIYRVMSSVQTPNDNKAPSVPTGLVTIVGGCSQINMSWNASTDPGNGSGLKGYNVYRNGIFLKQVLAPATATSYTGLAASTTYNYAVAAVDNARNVSARSTPATETTYACVDSSPPTVPTGLAGTPVSCSQINLAWYPSADTGGSGLKGYNIYRNGAFLKQVMTPTTSTTDT